MDAFTSLAPPLAGRPGPQPAPPQVPKEIFEAALGDYLAGKRLDMKELGVRLRISRATLYRRAGNRDQLLGAVILHLMRHVIDKTLAETEHLSGAERLKAAARFFMTAVHAQQPFRRFLDQEPEAALRILTSKHGPIQSFVVHQVRRLIEREQARSGLNLGFAPQDLAYIIVRIGESFLYADVIADSEPDIELAVELIGRIVQPQPADVRSGLSAES